LGTRQTDNVQYVPKISVPSFDYWALSVITTLSSFPKTVTIFMNNRKVKFEGRTC
jgi:hypothetical protein